MILWGMGTEEDRIDVRTGRCGLREHSIMNPTDVGHWEDSSANPGLIGCHRDVDTGVPPKAIRIFRSEALAVAQIAQIVSLFDHVPSIVVGKILHKGPLA